MSRSRLVIVTILGIIFIAGLLTWFAVIPGIVESKTNGMLAEVTQKTGRTVKLGRISITGLTEFSLSGLSISDVDTPESVGVEIGYCDINLSSIPIGDFRIASIKVDDVDVHLRHDGSRTNFEDILDMLKPPETEAEAPVPPIQDDRWRKYITPLPKITVKSFEVHTDPIAIRDDISMTSISIDSFTMRTKVKDGRTSYTLSSNISVTLDEDGEESQYTTVLNGNFTGRKNGEFHLSYPKSRSGHAPRFLKNSDYKVDFKEVRIELPTTFEMTELDIIANKEKIVQATSVRTRLMSFPPKKVNGVYFKEIELVDPVVHDAFGENGSKIIRWAKDLKAQWIKTVNEPKNKNNDNAVKVPKDPKDYFFSQRFFITNGELLADDVRKNSLTDFGIKKLNVEVGYRSIRRVVDFQISYSISAPFEASMGIDGQYVMETEKAMGKVDLYSLHGTNDLKQLQAKLTDRKEKGESLGIAERILAAFDFQQTELSGQLGFDADLAKTDLVLDGNLKTDKLIVSIDTVSRIPLSLDGSVSFKSNLKPKQDTYRIDNLEYTAPNGAHILFSGSLQKGLRKTKEKPGKPSRDVSAWLFSISSTLPDQSMQSIFEAIPLALRPELSGMEWTGSFGFKFNANGALDVISDTLHTFTMSMSPDFGVSKWPIDRDLTTLNTGLTLNVNDPNALLPHTIAIPPSTYAVMAEGPFMYIPTRTPDDIREMYPNWVIFDDLNPWLIQLITTTEDGSFFVHSGFSPMQIKSALEKNVSRSEFTRGASTISMQLIKNMFFDRNKTISRKVQEVIYTWLMESVVHIPKQRIMELYFNIIEFGPEIYGIEEASKYYFGKRSVDLNLKESAFLMAIIPSPRRGAYHRGLPKLERSIQKMMNFYIEAMYSRKCNPDVLAKMRTRYAQMHQSMPFEPCCPPKSAIQNMLENDTIAFHIPNPDKPEEYGYRPDMYTQDGTPLTPTTKRASCGIHSGNGNVEMESIFEIISEENKK